MFYPESHGISTFERHFLKRRFDLRRKHTYISTVVSDLILILTDVEADGQLVSETLERGGFNVVLRPAQKESLDAIESEQVGLLVLDARNQTTTTPTLCKLARRSPRGAVIPILVLGTGKEDIRTSADAIALGADFFFLVESELGALLRKCEHYLGRPLASSEGQVVHSTSTQLEGVSGQNEWAELDRLMTDTGEHDLGELPNDGSRVNADLDLLASRMAPDLEIPGRESIDDAHSTDRHQVPSHSRKGLQVGRAVDLNDRGLGSVLFSSHALSLTGRIEIASNGVLRRVFFDEGMPVYVDSSADEEDLVATLVQEGLLTEAQLEVARRQSRELNLSPEEVLIDTGQVIAEDVQQALKTYVERSLIELFVLESGECVVIQGGPRPVDPVTLDMPIKRLVLDGIRRKYGRLRLYRVFGTGSLIPSRALSTELDFRLTATEDTVLRRIDGKTTVNGIARATGLGETECLALVYGLSVLNLIEVPKLVRTSASTLALPSSQYAFASPPRTSDALPGFTELVTRKHRQVMYADYFSILGVGRDSTRAEIDAAYRQLEAQFDPNRVRMDSPLRSTVEDIAQVLRDAHQVLNNDSWRARYELAIEQAKPQG